jgi:hypothetical protein
MKLRTQDSIVLLSVIFLLGFWLLLLAPIPTSKIHYLALLAIVFADNLIKQVHKTHSVLLLRKEIH